MELTEIDFKILETAASFNAFQIESILSSLPDDKYNTNYRMDELVSKELIEKVYIFQGQSPSGAINQQFAGEYKITDLGKRTLQDYKLVKKSEQRRKYEDWAWRTIPIIISLLALAKSYNLL